MRGVRRSAAEKRPRPPGRIGRRREASGERASDEVCIEMVRCTKTVTLSLAVATWRVIRSLDAPGAALIALSAEEQDGEAGDDQNQHNAMMDVVARRAWAATCRERGDT